MSGAAALAVGDPAQPGTQVGPLASERRLEHVRELVEKAVAEGARLHCGGPVSPEGCAGAFYAPAVLSGVTPEMRLMREPVDGPVLAVDDGRLDGRGDRPGQRQRVQPRRIGMDAGPLPGLAHRPRAARGDGLAQRPPAQPGGLARAVGRCRGRGTRPDARRGRSARVRAGEADRLEPTGDARAVVGALRPGARGRRAGGGPAALGARFGPRVGVAARCGRAGPSGSESAGARGAARA